MTCIVLPGGTDVAEVALFSLARLPKKRVDQNDFDRMEKEGAAVRFPTGADGGYLLHIYLDEPIPPTIRQYCVEEETISGTLSTATGEIGFGGIESAFSDFKPNNNIRSDAVIPPGEYRLIAYQTNFPDELYEEAARKALTPQEQRLLNSPRIIIPAFLVLMFAGGVMTRSWMTPIALFALMVATLRFLFRTKAYKRVDEANTSAQMCFPSIAVEMRSSNSMEALP